MTKAQVGISALSHRERFYHRVASRAWGCWLWQGGIVKCGYGSLSIDGKTLYAHRLSYELHYGEIPEGFIVRHKCDTRACVNPAHLELGTVADNANDCAERGRSLRGTKNAGNKLSETEVLQIRERLKTREPVSSIARAFGVKPNAVYCIRNGETWAWLKPKGGVAA